MANPPRLVIEAFMELNLEPRQYVKVETTNDFVDGLVDFYNLVFFFS